ncbi:MAG TPA: DNA alkylation repair protein [Gemmatimonadales bacterium]|nr:DNA alkylation repair protein [Gemmatimonadales bacterium]
MPDLALTARAVKAAIRRDADPERAEAALWYFKTGPGEYGEGDRFLGVAAAPLRRISRQFRNLPLSEVDRLLASPWHEDRSAAVLILGEAYPRSDPERQERIYRLYLSRTDRVNGWDLVDCSAAEVVGRHLRHRSRKPLHRLARSRSLWERRIAIVATKHWIREGELDETMALAERMVHDPEDLIQKAVGWMLREVGQPDQAALERFLDRHAATMPRTMLRYAVERLPATERKRYMAAAGRKRPTAR